MKRWNAAKNTDIENPKIDAFIEEVIAVCKRHGLSIGHEDGHGAFEIGEADEHNFKWLRDATDVTPDNVDAIPFVEGARRSSLVPEVSRPVSKLEQWVNATPERKAAFDKEYAKAEEVEEHWNSGHRAAWTSMLQTCLSELDYVGNEVEHAKWVIEREAAVVALREVCAEHGDNEWQDNLFLADVIEKHLGRHLDSLKTLVGR